MFYSTLVVCVTSTVVLFVVVFMDYIVEQRCMLVLTINLEFSV